MLPAFRPTRGGFLTILAGLLLFLPGFLTDLVGAVLLIRPVRRWCGQTFRRWVRRRHPGDRSTIDLAPGEWRHLPDRELAAQIPQPRVSRLRRVLVGMGAPC